MTSDFGWGPIPGATPIDDISGLLVKGMVSRKELDQLEAENIAVCASAYLVGRLTQKESPFNFEWFFSLHREMFGQVWVRAGTP